MRTKVVSIIVVSLTLMAVVPLFTVAQALMYEPSAHYPISDYHTYGMIFMPQHRVTVEDLTSKLLKLERENGYFGGDRQEETIRAKAKKYCARAVGVYPGTGNETDDSSHRAVKVTNDYFRNWCSKMPEIKNKDAVKALAAKHYRTAMEFEHERSRDNKLRKAERIQKSREDADTRMKAKQEWEDEVYRKNKLIEAQEARKSICKEMCLEAHKYPIAYFKCMEQCKKYE
jgi:hypothetical protein